MTRRTPAVILSVMLALTACSVGAGLQVLSSPEDKIRVERTAHTFLQTLPFKYLGRSYTLDIMGDDRAAAWNVESGIIYISQHAARHASDDELAQLIAHALGHDLLAHPVIRTDVSDSRLAAELTTIAVVPGGLLLGGIVEAMTGSTDYTLAQEIEAERIGLRLWLRSGRSCATWIALRGEQKERGGSWHEPIKDVAPPLDELAALAERECGPPPSRP
ncbi:MAG: M48 family metalloprotease [candidate division NC10 bacterium]